MALVKPRRLLALVRYSPIQQAVLASLAFLGVLVAGIFLFFWNELDWQVHALEQQVKIVVFLEDSADKTRQQQLQEHFSSLPDISEVHYISKEDAAEKVRSAGSLGQSLWAEQNPFPASFVLVPKHVSFARVDALSKALEQLDNVEEVVSDTEGSRRMDIVRLHQRLLNVLGMIVVFLLTAGGLLRLWDLLGQRLWKEQVIFMAYQMFLGCLGSAAALGLYQGLMGPAQDFGISGTALSSSQSLGLVFFGGLLTYVLGQLQGHAGVWSLSDQTELLPEDLDLDWHFKDITSKSEELVSKS